MNKIYKVVWSKVKNCYVVVSEIAKNVISGSVKSAKIGSTPVTRGLALGAMMAFVITGNVWANVVEVGDYSPETKLFQYSTDNNSEGYGGAINHSNGKLTIVGTTFDANYIDSGRGAAIYSSTSEVAITDSKFINHDASSAYSVIYLKDGSMLLEGNVFNNGESAIHVADSHITLSGNNEFLNHTTSPAIMLTDDDSDPNTTSSITFKENSYTLFSGATTGYDIGGQQYKNADGNNRNRGAVIIEKGATVVAEAGVRNDTLKIDGGTLEIGGLGDTAGYYCTLVDELQGENGVIAIDSKWFDDEFDNLAFVVRNNQSTNTVIKARDVDLKGGAAQVLKNVVDELEKVVENRGGNDLVFATAAVDSVLRGDVELKDGKVTTVMDTDTLIAREDVKAGEVSLVETAEAVKGKADKATTLEGYGITDAYTTTEVDDKLAGKVDSDAERITIGKGASDNNSSDSFNNSIVIGYYASSEDFVGNLGQDNIVMGERAHAYSASNAIAVGSRTTIKGASGGIAAGYEAYVTGNNSVGLGFRAYTGAENSVALGAGSSTSEEGVISVGHQVGDVYHMAGSSTESKYTDTLTRKIINVKAGELSEDSTEAVVGSQLYATNQNVANLEANKADKATTLEGYGITDAYTTTEVDDKLAGKVDSDAERITIGKGASDNNSSDSFNNSIVIGYYASSEDFVGNLGQDNIVMGERAHAYSASNAIAVGSRTTIKGASGGIAAGYEAYVTGNNSVGLGFRAYTGAENSVALGAGSSTSEEGVISVGHQVGDVYHMAGSSTESKYTDTLTRKIINVKAGELSETSTEAVVGSQLYATNQNVEANKTAIGNLQTAVNNNTTAIANNATAINSLQTAVGENEAAIEGLNGRMDSAESVIGNLKISAETNLQAAKDHSDANLEVAKGYADTQDATNLQAAKEHSDANLEVAKGYADGIVADETTARIAGDEANAQAISGLNQRLGKLNGKINKVGAGAAALAALHPLEYDPDDKLTFSAGVGNYNGENAAALGAFYRPDEKLMFSLGGTMGNGENMVNLGVSIGLDGAKGTPKLSRKELAQKVSTMEAENEAIKAENQALEDRVAKLEALVAKLAEK